jgi:hypothetical protein
MKTFYQVSLMYVVGLMLLPLAPIIAMWIILEDFYLTNKNK